MKIEMKKPAECGGLRRGQFVCLETDTERGARREYFSVRNWRVALALWVLRVGANRQR